jgi:DNA-binding NtrC family response regulator
MATTAQRLGMTDANETQERASRVLVVDDEDIISVLLAEILTEEGYEVTAAANGNEAVNILEREKFDLIITDMVMPGMNGIEVLQAAFRLDPSYAVIMITGFPSVDTAVRLVTLGAADYITKPFNVDLIKVTVAKVLAGKRFRREAHPSGGEPSDQMAPVDKVTGAYNLYLFTQMLETEAARSTFRRHDLSLLVVEIDKYEN